MIWSWLIGNESEFQIPGYIIKNAGGLGDVRIARGAHWVKAHATKTIARRLKGKPVLQRETKGPGKTLDETRERRTFLAHLDEDLANLPILKQPDRQIPFVARDGELMCHRTACRREYRSSIGS